jgi:hypothetical protein
MKDLALIIDNSKKESIKKRVNGIYKVYNNLFIDDCFIDHMTYILEDLYDNNEFVHFNLYFFV